MIALWHEGALGDLLIARLAIRALRKKYARQKIILFARHEARIIFKKVGLVDEAWPTSLSLLEKIKMKLNKAYVFSHQKELEELLTSLSGFPWQKIPSRPPELEKHLALVQWQKVGSLAFTKEDLFLEKDLPKGRFIFIHPGGGGSFKCASIKFWLDVYTFLKNSGFNSLFLLGPGEKDLKNKLPQDSYVILENIEMAWQKLKEGLAFLGHDSGLSHLAAALGLPTLALFGPTRWQNWAPFGHVLVVQTSCECLKNNKDPRICGGLCLKNITFEAVKPVFQKYLSTIPRSYPDQMTKKEVEPGLQLKADYFAELGIEVVEVAVAHFL
ncbi:hypothetical protein TH606_01515 [Thermodesulfatator autotrophicus]|uniref:Heptosyltransferase n=1 Tax=Thermodesulfatator autotrophicus TaxID=1795632 RepID=A0A177E995_9BACT|nr:glycosyltransferase family 9 protein [Thermodesulfatator autotrophicus]OAG28534.1 hypothetical protein TH606_01515 [Thermodesulfatator autotrophicus]